MITKIINIHGTSSKVTFECQNGHIIARGEFLAKEGKIEGFVVSTASLKHEDGKWLTSEERKELVYRYEEYSSQPNIHKKWILEFE